MFSVGDRVVVDLTGLVPVSSTGIVMEVIKGPPLQYRVKVLSHPGGWQDVTVDANRVQPHP